MTLTYLFNSSFSELEGHGGELGTCLSVLLCLVELCEGPKWKVGAKIGLICRHYEDLTSSNVIALTRVRAGDMQTDRTTTEDIVNIEVIEDLLCFICDDGREDKVLSRVTDPSREETFSTFFFQCPSLESDTLEIIMVILLKLV